jgi:hypothetical protein
MKLLSLVSALLVASVQATPAIVWTTGEKQLSVERHSSEEIDSQSVISAAVKNSPESLVSVVFLIGRDENGNDALTTLASAGALPLVKSKYEDASAIHHNVGGMQNSAFVAKEARKVHGNVMELSLAEFLKTKETVDVNRARALSSAKVIIVNASPKESAELDAAVSNAVENADIHSVILTAVRSVDEVKHARNLMAQGEAENLYKQSVSRRLQNDDANAAANQDITGIYYVSITPNILAGVLFMFFFISVTYLAITCMGQISCTDVYAEKYPAIGREA